MQHDVTSQQTALLTLAVHCFVFMLNIVLSRQSLPSEWPLCKSISHRIFCIIVVFIHPNQRPTYRRMAIFFRMYLVQYNIHCCSARNMKAAFL